MKLLSRHGNAIQYEATFWEGPVESGSLGSSVRRTVHDRIVERRRANASGESRLLGHRLANTSRAVSYYPALEKALGIKWGEL